MHRPIESPSPSALWDDIGQFVDKYAKEINGYRVVDQAGKHFQLFLKEAEADFNRDGTLPDDQDTLLALVYLAVRRVR